LAGAAQRFLLTANRDRRVGQRSSFARRYRMLRGLLVPFMPRSFPLGPDACLQLVDFGAPTLPGDPENIDPPRNGQMIPACSRLSFCYDLMQSWLSSVGRHHVPAVRGLHAFGGILLEGGACFLTRRHSRER
jgi:hypothetical protein